MKLLNTLILCFLSATGLYSQIGIGTTSPTVPLDIEAADAEIDINNTAADPLIHFQLSGVTNFTIGTDLTDSKFKIGTTALETGTAVTVQSTGEVGIGTTSPTAMFEVDGSVIFNESNAAVDFRVEGDTDPGLFFVDGSADMVGISTQTPGATLDVAGSAQFNKGGDAVDFKIEGDTDEELFFVDGSADMIGVSTNTPAATLDVEGTFILLNGTSINELSTDGTLAGNSDDAVPTEQAVKTYVDGLIPSLTKTITIESPTNTDYFPLFRTDVAITIVEAIGMLNAVGDVDVRLYWDTDFAETAPTAVGTTTTLSTTAEATVNIGSDATIPADSWIFIDIPESTTPQTVTVSVRYTED